MSNAVEWIEKHPDSPYNLKHTEIVHRSVYFAGTVCVQIAERNYYAGNVIVQPMIWLKEDDHNGSWRWCPPMEEDENARSSGP